MQLDMMTLMVATALVVIVGGSCFLVETVRHWGSRAARLWSLAFISAITSTVAFIAWAAVESGWIALVVGNTAFTAAVGFLFLGCRSFNGRSLRRAGWIVFAVCLVIVVSALLEGEGENGWGGSLTRFVGTAIFAILGAIESRRGVLGRRPASTALTVAFGLAAAYYLGRSIVFVSLETENPIFQIWFGTSAASIVTISLVVIALGSLSVLRAIEGAPGVGTGALVFSGSQMLNRESFEHIVDGLLLRAEALGEGYAIVALRIEDLSRITTAFGRREAEAVLEAWQKAVLSTAPLSATIGEEESASVLLGVPLSSPTDIRRLASRMQQRISDSFLESATVLPTIGVGVAVAGGGSRGAADLVDEADTAARESLDSVDGAVIVRGD